MSTKSHLYALLKTATPQHLLRLEWYIALQTRIAIKRRTERQTLWRTVSVEHATNALIHAICPHKGKSEPSSFPWRFTVGVESLKAGLIFGTRFANETAGVSECAVESEVQAMKGFWSNRRKYYVPLASAAYAV